MFQPRFAPALIGLTSSTMFWPMSDMYIAPFSGSQPKRCMLRMPYAKNSGRASAVFTNGFAAGTPYLPLRLLFPSGSIRIFAERGAEILREVHRVAAAAAISDADVKEPEIGGARPCQSD